MRIVHVVDYLMPGLGYQEMLLPVWNARHGHETHVVTSDRYAPAPDYKYTFAPILGPRLVGTGSTSIEGVSVHRLRTLFEWQGRVWLDALVRSVDALSPDAIFMHGTSCTSAFRLARWARRYRVPMVMDNHMTFSSQRRTLAARLYYAALRQGTRRQLMPAAYRFLGVAQECCDFLASIQGVPRECIELLPLGVDTTVFRPDPAAAAAFRARLGVPGEARLILQSGKITPDKGADLLAVATAPLMAQDRSLRLVLLGGGAPEFLGRITDTLSAHGVADRLIVHPFVPAAELAGAFSAANLCVFAKAASLSCLEAAACGAAVLMNDMPICRWRAEMGVGATFTNGDATDLRRRIAEFLSDASLRDRTGSRARASVVSHFSYDAVAAHAEEILARAIKDAGTTNRRAA